MREFKDAFALRFENIYIKHNLTLGFQVFAFIWYLCVDFARIIEEVSMPKRVYVPHSITYKVDHFYGIYI